MSTTTILPGALLSADADQVATVIQTEERYTPKRTPVFDFDAGEFRTNSLNIVAMTDDPNETLKAVVEKILHDDRYKYLAYDASYGNEVRAMLAEDYPFEIIQAELQRLYTEALIYHPAIRGISDFSAQPGSGGDSISVTFTVHGTAGVDYTEKREVFK